MDDAKLDKLLKFENPAAAPAPEQLLARIRTQHTAQEPRAARSSRVLLWTLFSLAALALCAILYLNSRPDSTSTLPGDNAPVAACFADAAEFRAKVRLAGIVGDTVLLEHLDTGKQQLFRKDDTLFDYKITRIGEGEVEFAHVKNADDSFTLKLKGDGNIDAAKPADGSFVLQGTVYDFDGKPTPGATVYAEAKLLPGRYYANTMADWSIADTEGRYFLRCPQAVEKLSVFVRLRGRNLVYEVGGPWDASATVDLRPPCSFTLSGTVKDQRGNPLPGVEVTLSPGKLRTRTDAQGKWALFSILPVSAAQCFISIGQQPYTAIKESDWSADATLDFTLELPDYFVIRGGIVLQKKYPLPHTQLCFQYKNEDKTNSPTLALTDADGVFCVLIPADKTVVSIQMYDPAGNLRALREGAWSADTMLHIDALGWNDVFSLCGTVTGIDDFTVTPCVLRADDGRSAAVGKTGRYALLSDCPIRSVNALPDHKPALTIDNLDIRSDFILDIDLRKAKSFTIKGRVLDAAGKGAFRHVVSAPALGANAVVDADGNYQLRVFGDAGVETLTVTAPGLFVTKTVDIKIDTTYDIDLSKEKLFTLRGTVKLDTGEPVAFASISFQKTGWPSPQAYTSVQTDADGNYRLTANVEIHSIRLGWKGGSKTGPWSSDATVDITTSVDQMTAE